MLKPLLLTLPPLLFLATACTTDTPGPIPVDADRLVPMLAEMHLAESLVTEVPVVLRDSMREVFYDGVLSEHGSTQEEFDSLMWIVRQEPAWVDSLYVRAGAYLAERSTQQ
ncbi:DUF4296 domain-containing protein [Lewinella sp. 4G2]|uniref:DUF4296 domain-containing protein n=1 Tax=Lewinella sp. 4G2 TaxID=1803372 RepID=UPI0007B467A3|nr:DUF4296 domain-containing protein [Lewinella sp. 4G2]OAV46170.1 hypothetical protein A3850_018085 [Lewinella sp. 4G2]